MAIRQTDTLLRDGRTRRELRDVDTGNLIAITDGDEKPSNALLEDAMIVEYNRWRRWQITLAEANRRYPNPGGQRATAIQRLSNKVDEAWLDYEDAIIAWATS